jgi:putative transposase
MRLTDKEFETWCKSLKLGKETIAFIDKVRKTPPVRSVGGNRRNVPGRFSSLKMGMTIQFESHSIELAGIYSWEHSSHILEFYDQPCILKVSYINQNGKRISYNYTPDFLVLSEDRVVIQEWKTEEKMNELSLKDSTRYYKDETGKWRCPSCEEAAKNHGIQFEIVTSKDINNTLYRNLLFLEDYLNDNHHKVNSDNQEEIISLVSNNFSITLSDLIKSITIASVDDIYKLIATNKIYVDLERYIISNLDSVPVFQTTQHCKAYEKIEMTKIEKLATPKTLELNINNVLIWDKIEWRIINNGVDAVSLLSSNGEVVELPRIYLIELFNKSRIYSKALEIDIDSRANIPSPILEASPEDLEVANKRWEIILSYTNKKDITDISVTDRTIRTWLKDFRNAEELYGYGYIGLFPKHKSKGNRTPKIPSETLELMNEFIEKEYENIKQKNKYVVYGQLVIKCEEKQILVPSYKTFCLAVNNRPKYEQIRSRKGERAAYEYEEFCWHLSSDVPRHGDFPFQFAHVDHTEFDLELICSKTKRVLGRPYITFLVDAYTRKVLSFYLSFDPPSYRSTMMVMRKCVESYNRLPKNFIVDGGKEFHSTYFDTLLAYYKLHKKVRPPAKARFGNVIERLFGTTNTNLIHNLQGNTKIMKNVRQVTKSVNPKNHAIWTLDTLNGALKGWIEEIYHKQMHPGLDGQTPNEAFELGCRIYGHREFTCIRHDDEFLVMTLPSTKNGKVKINSRTGVKVNYINYWNSIFKSPKLEGETVSVRYDPFNIGIVYVFVNKKWTKCLSELHHVLKGKTEKELKIVTEQIKKSKSMHAKNYTINARKIAGYMNNLEENERVMVQNLKDAELKKTLNSTNLNKEPLISEISDLGNEEDADVKPVKKIIQFKEFNTYQKGG